MWIYQTKRLFIFHFALVQLCEIDVTLLPPTIVQTTVFCSARAGRNHSSLLCHHYAECTIKVDCTLYAKLHFFVGRGYPLIHVSQCESSEENMCANSIADWFCPSQGCTITHYKAACARSYDLVVSLVCFK